MSTDVRTQTGQVQTGGDGPSAGAEEMPKAGLRENPQTLIQESIKYRRRAQDAERHLETLEAELQGLRQSQDDRSAALEAQLAEARTEAETLRGHLESVERDRQLERELSRAGCADAETALALAHQRLVSGPAPEDLAAFARSLLEEKPHLRVAAGSAAAGGPARHLPPPSAAAKPSGQAGPRRAADRLADQARRTGSAGDLMAYMRARRTVVV